MIGPCRISFNRQVVCGLKLYSLRDFTPNLMIIRTNVPLPEVLNGCNNIL